MNGKTAKLIRKSIRLSSPVDIDDLQLKRAIRVAKKEYKKSARRNRHAIKTVLKSAIT